MKKLLAIALIATSFVACNDSETKTEPTADTAAVVAPAVDTAVKAAAAVVDTAVKAVVDTTKK